MTVYRDAYQFARQGGDYQGFLQVLAQAINMGGPGPVQRRAAKHVKEAELATDRGTVNGHSLWGLAHYPYGVLPWVLNDYLFHQGYRHQLRQNYEATRLGTLRKLGLAYAKDRNTGAEYYGKIYAPTDYEYEYTPDGRPSALHWISDLGWVVLNKLIGNGVYPPLATNGHRKVWKRRPKPKE